MASYEGVTGDGGEGPSGTSGRPESSAVGALREESSSAAESSEPPAGPGELPLNKLFSAPFRDSDFNQNSDRYLKLQQTSSCWPRARCHLTNYFQLPSLSTDCILGPNNDRYLKLQRTSGRPRCAATQKAALGLSLLSIDCVSGPNSHRYLDLQPKRTPKHDQGSMNSVWPLKCTPYLLLNHASIFCKGVVDWNP